MEWKLYVYPTSQWVQDENKFHFHRQFTTCRMVRKIVPNPSCELPSFLEHVFVKSPLRKIRDCSYPLLLQHIIQHINGRKYKHASLVNNIQDGKSFHFCYSNGTHQMSKEIQGLPWSSVQTWQCEKRWWALINYK